MATNIHQNVLEVSSTPTDGQPWNFNGILQSYLIPRVIAADADLLPGARLLWAVIRQYSGHGGRCLLSDKALAAYVGVQWRQCIRYCRQLERAGLLRTTLREGLTPVRELLWNGRFAGTMRKPPVLEDSTPCPPSQAPLSSKADIYKEEGSLKVVNRLKSATIEKAKPSTAPSLPVRRPPPERTEEEIIRRGRACGFPEHVIQRDIERLRERRANPSAERMVKASELKPELAPSTPR